MNSAGPLDQGRQEHVNYLLGLLPETERDRQRERLFSDAEEFARLRDVENELFDAYARGLLAPAQREAFERTLLRQAEAPAKLRAARALMTAEAAARPGRFGFRHRPVWIGLLAAAALAVASLMLFLPAGKAPEVPRAVAKAAQQSVTPAAAVIAQPFRLLPVTRSGETQRLVLDAATTAIDFSADPPAGAIQADYEVEISSGGKAVWTGRVAPANGALQWRVPRLQPGSYVIRLGPASAPLSFFEFLI